jgi:hypothetical protein
MLKHSHICAFHTLDKKNDSCSLKQLVHVGKNSFFFDGDCLFSFLIAETERACSLPSSGGSEATSSEGNVLSYTIAEFVPCAFLSF